MPLLLSSFPHPLSRPTLSLSTFTPPLWRGNCSADAANLDHAALVTAASKTPNDGCLSFQHSLYPSLHPLCVSPNRSLSHLLSSHTTPRSFPSPPDTRSAADGSVVLAAVYGPRTIQARKENTEHLAIEVNYRPASGMQSKC